MSESYKFYTRISKCGRAAKEWPFTTCLAELYTYTFHQFLAKLRECVVCSERSNARVAAKKSAGVMSKSIEEHAILILRIYDPTSQRSQSANLLVLLDSNLHMHVLNMLYPGPANVWKPPFINCLRACQGCTVRNLQVLAVRSLRVFEAMRMPQFRPAPTHGSGLVCLLPCQDHLLSWRFMLLLFLCDHMYVEIEEKT